MISESPLSGAGHGLNDGFADATMVVAEINWAQVLPQPALFRVAVEIFS
jgi:hypothetical protein